ncbi:MAG: S9 family peptidase [Phycisphaerales bacterium]|nr:S9 family peptidase [Phycisphaerales bacterium]
MFVNRIIAKYSAVLLTICCSHARCDDGDILERHEIARDENAIVERVIYESDGLRILGYLMYPCDALDCDEKLPCLMYNRGGNRDFGMFTDESAARIASRFVSWGYVIFASNYRGSAGSEGQDEFGGDDVHDVLNGLRVFDQLGFADAERIGMWGHSRGGLMTLLALLETSRIGAAIVCGAVSDLHAMVHDRPAMEAGVLRELVPDYESRRDEALDERSPINRVDALPKQTPMLVVHGNADWRVSPTQSLNLVRSLIEHQLPHRLVMFEGNDHSISENRDDYYREARHWLDRFVRDGESLPNMEPHGP